MSCFCLYILCQLKFPTDMRFGLSEYLFISVCVCMYEAMMYPISFIRKAIKNDYFVIFGHKTSTNYT